MLSLHTNAAALSTENALNATQESLTNTLTQLGTGYRVNSAMDDAAGLQIATRLTSETQGMTQAQSNTADGISMLQTADGALSETSNILLSMKDLATEAATASSSASDQTALQSQYNALGQQLLQIFQGSTYGGEGLLSDGTAAGAAAGTGGALSAALQFQIGDQASDTMTVNTSAALTQLATDLGAATAEFSAAPPAGGGTELTGTGTQASGIASANAILTNLTTAINDVGALRSQIGAGANRLQDVSANLTNMITNTTTATGQIMDVDYASASSTSTSDQLLLQAGTAALKQANSVSQLVVTLLQ